MGQCRPDMVQLRPLSLLHGALVQHAVFRTGMQPSHTFHTMHIVALGNALSLGGTLLAPLGRLVLPCLLQLVALLLGLVYGRGIVLGRRVDGVQDLSFAERLRLAG